jgi:hypothetical protein
MPKELLKAHRMLDREVMRLYGYAKDAPEPEIVADLMQRYARLAEGSGGLGVSPGRASG